jgi:rhomboid protease GluP
MENDVAIFWVVCFYCLFGLFSVLKRLSSSHGWVAVYLAILAVDVAGLLWERPAIIYAAGGLWLLLVLIPGLMSRACQRRILQQDHAAARRLARIISWLHPFDGWRQQPEILHALELARRGEITPAMETLKHFREVKSLMGLAAIGNLYRITGRWEEYLVWEGVHRQEIEKYPQLLQMRLRSRAETGDLKGLVQLYDQHKKQIAKLTPATSRDLCRVILFAFCGRSQEVERLFAGSLSILPSRTRGFWLAMADWSAGKIESAKLQWEGLLPTADPQTRLAIEQRLSRIAIPPQTLAESDLRVIADAANERGPDENFGRRHRPA